MLINDVLFKLCEEWSVSNSLIKTISGFIEQAHVFNSDMLQDLMIDIMMKNYNFFIKLTYDYRDNQPTHHIIMVYYFSLISSAI
jgi:hypothetical protein